MAEATGRPQDQGRRHRRKQSPAPGSLELLARYQDTLRLELTELLDQLGGTQRGLDGAPLRPQLGERAKLWDLAMRIGRELRDSPEDPPAPAPEAAEPPRRRRRIDYGGA